ncbi:trans-aconitate 2-methyltransferase [Derxia gummosa]|uniref:Trans-aconitate 2-methyltransferase n=1 Tax=Derxia gummosa DSM 723 TaxID=1121388 RepID=A0A8B6X143_9BURK|nr:trans-aconitate 2-methyltransferase [Derxia gummosa]
MTRPDWNASLYLKFEDERSRPARDLLAQVRNAAPRQVIDLGCGPGNSTELLAARWPDAEIAGLDSSPNMLAEARKRLPRARFELADLASWLPDREYDVIFANAVFQWLPDHPAILRRLLESLAPGGTLAVQMPDNLAEPSHRLMKDVAAAGQWADRLAGAARDPLPAVRDYYDRLAPVAARIDLWHTHYNHALFGAAAVVEWVSSTGLKPFLDPLDETERADFIRQYTAAIAAAYPLAEDGRLLLRFPRLFIVAERGQA